MMRSWIRAPLHPELSDVVQSYWVASDEPQMPLVLPPAASNDVVLSFQPPTAFSGQGGDFHIDGDYYSGVRTCFFRVEQFGGFKLFGIRFKPWVFSLHFALEPDRHVNTFSALGQCEGALSALGDLKRQIDLDMRSDELADIADQFLKSRFAFDEAPRANVRSIIDSIDDGGPGSISRAARMSGISISTLERLIKRYIGITPKTLCRVARFDKVWIALNDPKNESWSDALRQLDYYDQAHFIKEFKEFTGTTPAEYSRERNSTLDRYRLFDEKLQAAESSAGIRLSRR